jgi:hypothetical protein
MLAGPGARDAADRAALDLSPLERLPAIDLSQLRLMLPLELLNLILDLLVASTGRVGIELRMSLQAFG